MNLSNENKLLIYCARTGMPGNKLEEIKYLVSLPLNWEELLESAFSQGIAPLLYYNLKNIRKNNLIPQEVMDYLKKIYHGNVARNMHLFTELRSILETFNECKIDVMVLKGAALAGTVYGNIGLRSFDDIDLLVKKDHLSAVEKIMERLNYVNSSRYKSNEWYRQNHYHLSPYIHSANRTIVEIHWQIMNRPFLINIDEWWKRAMVVKINDCRVAVPSPEDMIIHLCLHLFNNGYNKNTLRGFCDISGILKCYGKVIDWQQFQDRISRYRINKPIYTTLYFLKKIDRNNDRLLSWIKPDSVNLKLLALLEKRILGADRVRSDIPSQLVQSIAADKFWDKAEILLKIIFPPGEVMSKQYSISISSKKIYFYYLIRPVKLFLKYGKFLFEIFRLKKYSIEG